MTNEKLIELSKPKKPKFQHWAADWNGPEDWLTECPNCEADITNIYDEYEIDYCPYCGQKLWREE